MPKVSEHKEARLRQIIRDALAIDPLITMQGVVRAVETKLGRPVDPRYVKKLVKRTTGEMVIIADREKVTERISYLRERNRIICNELLRIAFPNPNDPEKPGIIDRRKALESIARIENAQVKLEMDLGLFTRHLGKLDVDVRFKPLDDATRLSIINAMRVWDVKPTQPRKIDQDPPKAIVAVTSPVNGPEQANTAKPELIPMAGPVVVS